MGRKAIYIVGILVMSTGVWLTRAHVKTAVTSKKATAIVDKKPFPSSAEPVSGESVQNIQHQIEESQAILDNEHVIERLNSNDLSDGERARYIKIIENLGQAQAREIELRLRKLEAELKNQGV